MRTLVLFFAMALMAACGAADQVKDDVGETYDGAGETAGGAVEDVEETGEGAGDSAEGAVDDVKEAADDVVGDDDGEGE